MLTDNEAWFLAALIAVQVGPVQGVEDGVARTVTCTKHVTGDTLQLGMPEPRARTVIFTADVATFTL